MQDCVHDLDGDVYMLKSEAAEIKNELKNPGATGASATDCEDPATSAAVCDSNWKENQITWINENGEKFVLKTVWVPFSDDGNSGSWVDAWVKESHLQQTHSLDDEWVADTELEEDEGDCPQTSNQVAMPPNATETMVTSETGDINTKQPAATPESEKGVHLDENANGEGHEGHDIQLDEKGPVTTKCDDEGVETKGEESEEKTQKCEGEDHDESAEPVKPDPPKSVSDRNGHQVI